MIPVLDPDSMRRADQAGISVLGYSSLELMENAARSSVDIIRPMLHAADRVLVLCGTGNNGGDGFAVARLLASSHHVRVAWIGDASRMTVECAHEFKECVEAGMPCVHPESEESAAEVFVPPTDVIIDALVGIGASGQLRGLSIPLLRHANACAVVRIALDICTGVDAATGKAHEHCFRAHHTITMAAAKPGHCKGRGKEVCGVLHVADIGLTSAITDGLTSTYIFDSDDAVAGFEPRRHHSSKFDYGRICVIAGSRDMPGAAALCANAAIRSGAGMVEVCSTAFHPAMLPEVLQTHLEATEHGGMAAGSLQRVRAACERADCIVVGCGLGREAQTLDVVRSIIDEFGYTKPIVIDADALRCVPLCIGSLSRCILSPHEGEFRRLVNDLFERQVDHTGDATTGIVQHGDNPSSLASELGCVIVYKSVPVQCTDGDTTLWNIGGNPGMSTAGAGDVLAGVIAAMVVRRQASPMIRRVAAAVFIHARAGDAAAAAFSREGVTATRINDHVHEAMIEIEKRAALHESGGYRTGDSEE